MKAARYPSFGHGTTGESTMRLRTTVVLIAALVSTLIGIAATLGLMAASSLAYSAADYTGFAVIGGVASAFVIVVVEWPLLYLARPQSVSRALAMSAGVAAA